MPRRKIAKTLLVGLGGTGNLALKYAKKRFHEMYGAGKSYDDFDLPLIQYLALDTDIADLKKGIEPNIKKEILKPNECIHIKVSQPSQVLAGNPFIEREWMPKKNVERLDAIEAGAGQIRGFGRLGLMANFGKIKTAVKSKINKLNSWENDHNFDFEATDSGKYKDSPPLIVRNKIFCNNFASFPIDCIPGAPSEIASITLIFFPPTPHINFINA